MSGASTLHSSLKAIPRAASDAQMGESSVNLRARVRTESTCEYRVFSVLPLAVAPPDAPPLFTRSTFGGGLVRRSDRSSSVRTRVLLNPCDLIPITNISSQYPRTSHRKEKEDLLNRLQLEQKKFELDERQRQDAEKQKLAERIRKEVQYRTTRTYNSNCSFITRVHSSCECS